MQRGTALGGARIAIPCCKGTQAGMIPPRSQIDQIPILPLARRAQPTAATAALEAQIAPGIVDSREGQVPVASVRCVRLPCASRRVYCTMSVVPLMLRWACSPSGP